MLTPDQFDAACAAEPARSSCLMRLRAALGDERNGRELLRDWDSDRYRATQTDTNDSDRL